MKNKAHIFNELCKLKNIHPDSKEAQELLKLTIVDLLIHIKQEKNKKIPEQEIIPEPEPEPERSPEPEPEPEPERPPEPEPEDHEYKSYSFVDRIRPNSTFI